MTYTPVSNNNVYVKGSFNNWENPGIRMIPEGTVYSINVKLTPGEQIEYKFVNGDEIEENIPSGCTTGSYGNRYLTVPESDEVLATVCFNKCEACDPINPNKVQVTFFLDATKAQYQNVTMWHSPDYYNYYDADGDRIFELTKYLDPGQYQYHVLRDNAWGEDPANPLNPDGYRGNGSYMDVADPMISYLLPKDGDMIRENRIQANFAFSANNQPDVSTITVNINGNSVANASQYYNSEKRILLIENPLYLKNGQNQVTVQYTTPKGSVSRTSAFTYQPIKLMLEPMVYRMENILAWGRVFLTPYPNSVYMSCNGTIYQAAVNSEGYFGTEIQIQNGENQIKTAYTEAGLNDPVDQMTVEAEIRHKWWVELKASISETTAKIEAIPHGIDASELTLEWRNRESAKQKISGLGGNSSSVSFEVPEQAGLYEIELKVTGPENEEYYARKMLTTIDNPHFIADNERAPWMETMVLYEVEGDFFDWGQFTFRKLEQAFPHMVNLGVNSFRITPFVAGGFISWDHFAIPPSNGSIDDLRHMTETAHEYGLKVIFDVPISHIASFHPFITPSFLLKEQAEPFADFIMWQGEPGESDVVNSEGNGRQCVYTNLDNPYTQEYFIRLMEYWVEVAGCDGFRIDCGQESFLRAPDFSKELHKRLRNIKPELFILNEGDPRDYDNISFYDYGDAAYSWKLNSEWGDGGEGLPGIFKGVYTVDLLHDLIMAGIPSDSGLIMNYANSGYHDFLHNRYGWEQERAALALVSTTYGLVNIRAGEEVGEARKNGMYDGSDPLEVMPLYQRLLKARKKLLGNYPSIDRITTNIPSDVYAYTSKANGEVLLTVINLSNAPSSVTLDLNSSVLEGLGKKPWYNVVDDEMIDNTVNETMDISLEAWEANVYALNHINIEDNQSAVTFQVDMQNEEVTSSGVYLNGSFCNWDPSQAIQLTANQNIYSATVQLPVGETVEYKFVNGLPDNWGQYEIITGLPCAYGNDNNRAVVVPANDTTLETICFAECEDCIPSSANDLTLNSVKLHPNPTTGIVTVSNLPDDEITIQIFSIEGRRLMEVSTVQSTTKDIDLSSFNSGIYYLKIIGSDRTTETMKVVKN